MLRPAWVDKVILSKKTIKPQYFGIVEQILLSATNMLASLVVVGAAGMRWFGIYSFIFVLTTLAGAFLSTLLHRQMILQIASSAVDDRRRIFLATIVIQGIVMASAGFVFTVSLLLFPDAWLVDTYGTELIAAVVFVGVYSFYDLCRQYLYVLDEHAYSFRCTAIYVIVLLGGLAWIFLSVNPISVVSATYSFFSAALFISLLSNSRCLQECRSAEWISWQHTGTVLVGFFDQGRFRIVGMLITWLQNQSMNPFLMLVSGPLVAGFFSMARLLVMPMAVINQGLTNSTTPQLRRVFQAEGSPRLKAAIARYNRLNLGLSTAYLLVLGSAHASGLLERYVPSYDEVQWFLLIWIVTLLVTMYRYWLGQLFVVRLQFRFLMQVSIAALVVSMTGMVGVGYFLGNIYLALGFIVLGELFTIALFFIYAERLPQPEAPSERKPL